MDLATPAPQVETAVVEPIRESSSAFAEPAKPVEEATADPADTVEPAETTEDPLKFAPSNAVSYLKQRTKMSVEALRKDGVDFESRVAVCRGAPKKNFLKILLPMFFDQRDYITFSEICRYAVIRGGCCFIYLESTDKEPLYALSLRDLSAEIENSEKPDKFSCTVNPVMNTNQAKADLVTVLLRNKRTGKLAYQFTFEAEKDRGVVKRFMDVVQQCGPSGKPVEASVVRKGDNKTVEKEQK